MIYITYALFCTAAIAVYAVVMLALRVQHYRRNAQEARELVEDFVQVSDMTEGYIIGALQDRARRWLVGDK